jgi:hypothetical protein
MMKRPVGILSPVTNSSNSLFSNVLDEMQDMFVPDGVCVCCDKMKWLPLYISTQINGMRAIVEHNSKFDGGTKSEMACSYCDYKLIELKMFCIVNRNLVE